MSALVRVVTCRSCGAPSDHLEGGAYLSCAHCGALVEMREGLLFGEERAAMIRDAIRAQLRPTDAEARSTELTMCMASAQKAGDRRTWRAAMREYLLLLPCTRPGLLPPEVETAAQLAEFADRSSCAAELAAFDPDIAAAMKTMDASLVYGSPDPVAGAEEYIERARVYFETLSQHPDYPPAYAQHMNPHAMARDALRTMISGVASMMGPAAVRRVYIDVLGARDIDESSPSCPHCGAPLAQAAGRCSWCRTEISGEATDAWLSSLVSGFEAMRAAVADPEQLAVIAVSHPFSAHHFGGELPSAADARRFLEAAVPELSEAHLVRAIEMLRPAYPRAPFDELERGLREEWTPVAAAPRAAPEVAHFESVEAAAGSAWVRQQLALWPHARGGAEAELAMTLVSMALSPFHMGSAVSAEEMVAFFREAEPTLAPADLDAAIAQLLMAFAGHPRIADALRRARSLAVSSPRGRGPSR